MIDIVQSEAYGPLHVRLGNPAKRLKLVTDDAMDVAANDAAVNDAVASEDPKRDS